MFNLIKYYKIWFAVSGIILIFGLGSLFLFGLKTGIDFKGGTLLELKFEKPVENSKIKQALEITGIKNFHLQNSENNGILIKTENFDTEIYKNLNINLTKQAGEFKEIRYDSVGPVIGKELTQNAILQLILVSLGIIFYIGYAFRKVSKPVTSWRFGWSAIIALIHDLIFMLGFFSILGRFKGVEIDGLFITAILTVLGFSVHDTIVVFDRIRENLKTYAGQSIEFIINHSISQTLVRSFNTSLTVLFVLFSLLLFGGDTIHYFILALFVGIIVGTYSSIFIASPILAVWQKWKTKNI
jgi:preprotein translocase subunit SecF